MPRIGVLGGMGPAATILLQQRLIEAVPVTSDAGHIPLLIDMNPQVPSRIEFLIHGRGADPGPVLAEMARGLEACGVDALAMPCCTAHHFADAITDAVTTPFLNMVNLAAAELAAHGAARVGVLASPATDRIGLFRDALAPHKMTTLYPKDDAAMLGAIEAIKARGPGPREVDTVQAAIAELTNTGADAMLVGCSEFSLISRDLHFGGPLVDALDALTTAITGLMPAASD